MPACSSKQSPEPAIRSRAPPPRFALASRALPSPPARQIFPVSSSQARNRRTPKSPHRTLELSPALQEGDGPEVQKDVCAAPHLVPPAAPRPLLPSAFPSAYGPVAWMPLRPPPSVRREGSSAQGPCWAPRAEIGGSTAPWYTTGNIDDSDPQAWGLDSHPPGGFLSLINNNSSHSQAVSNGTSPQPINIASDTNGGDSARTGKRLQWTKEEDCRLISAWLNNSNDPIQSNYKKNDQYWKDVVAVYSSTTPKDRARLVKQVKDRFGRIKKRVAWFCASWKEANALYASGESDVDLRERTMKTYEADHKEDGPFIYEHCWEFLKKEPKWDAYLERLEDLEPRRESLVFMMKWGSISI